MNLPDFPELALTTLQAIAERHHLRVSRFSMMPEVGIFNRIYQLDEQFVLRVPRIHPAFIAAAREEAIVAPVARAAGVRTPPIVAFDDTLELLPVPYTIYERVHGATLGLLEYEPHEVADVWREVGRDLARLHHAVSAESPVAGIEIEALPDSRSWPEELAEDGYFTMMEARWLSGCLERLAPAALAPIPKRFLHGDVQATNIMVSDDGATYIALLDWGSAGWDDPAYDFAGMPLRAAPYMLEGYRSITPLDHDDTAEARILWRHLHLALFLLRREPQPERAWAERPLGMLLELMRFMLEAPGSRWREAFFG